MASVVEMYLEFIRNIPAAIAKANEDNSSLNITRDNVNNYTISNRNVAPDTCGTFMVYGQLRPTAVMFYGSHTL